MKNSLPRKMQCPDSYICTHTPPYSQFSSLRGISEASPMVPDTVLHFPGKHCLSSSMLSVGVVLPAHEFMMSLVSILLP